MVANDFLIKNINFLIKQHLSITVDFPFLAKIDGSLFRGCDEWADFIAVLRQNTQNLANLEPNQIDQAEFLSDLIIKQLQSLLYVAKLQHKQHAQTTAVSPQMAQAKQKRLEILNRGDYQSLQEYYKIQHQLNAQINQLEQQFISSFYSNVDLKAKIKHTQNRLEICRQRIDWLESTLN